MASRTQYATLGRNILKRAFENHDFKFSQKSLEGVLKKLARPSVDEALAAVGRSELAPEDIIRAIHPEWKDPRQKRRSIDSEDDEGWIDVNAGKGGTFRVPKKDAARKKTVRDGALPIRGYGDELPIRFAPEGGAVPGDKIVGILVPGEGITVYPIHALALAEFENQPERWLDVHWEVDPERPRQFPARIHIHAINEPGSLAQVTGVIAEHEGNIDNIKMGRRSPDFTELTIDLEVWDLKHLNLIISELRMRPNVSQVVRVNG